MTVSASRVQYLWSPLLGWALLTCSATMAMAQIGVAVPGVSDTPVTTSDQNTNTPTDQNNTGNNASSGGTSGTSTTEPPPPTTRSSTIRELPLPAGTTVANPSTQLIQGQSDTFAGGSGTTAGSGGAFFGGGAPGGDELGISVGSFRLYPSIDITTGIDNNVFASNTATTTPSLSLSTIVQPALALRSDWLNHSINFLMGGGFGFYASTPTQNYQNYFLIVDGKIDIREDFAALYSFGYRRATEALGTANVTFAQAPTVAESIPLTFALNKRFNRLTVEGGVSATRSWFTDYSTITSSGLDAQSRNRNAFSEYLRFGYDVTEDITVFLTPTLNQTLYDQNPDTLGQDRNSRQASLAIGASWVIGPTSSISGSIGYALNSGGLGSTAATIFSLSGSWTGIRDLTLSPNLSRAITETALSAYRNTVTTTLGFDWNYRVQDEFVLVGGFSYGLADYQPADAQSLGTATAAAARTDTFIRGSLGFAWQPRPQISFGPLFEYTQGSSSDSTGPAYTRELISLRLSARR